MDVLAKKKLATIKNIDLSWQSNILGSMMRLE
jgi:hypothetical protein